jgi:hypothetical protein
LPQLRTRCDIHQRHGHAHGQERERDRPGSARDKQDYCLSITIPDKPAFN